MEIEITSLLEMHAPDLSASRMELGDDAGRITWQAAKEQAEETPILNTPEKLDAMRDFARASGGWDAEEVAAWDAEEVNALFLQWIAGDVRELGADTLAGIDWTEAEEMQREGQASGNLFRAEDGRVFFYLGS
jgi:hypothetical protein